MSEASEQGRAPRQQLRGRQIETLGNLLAAARGLLDRGDHESLTIRAVAREAGVAPATAYTYFGSREHLLAEMLLRQVTSYGDGSGPAGATRVERVQHACREIARALVSSPALAAASTPALLGTDPDVARLRVRIGGEFARRLTEGLGEHTDDELETLLMVVSGALLHAGMGFFTYDEMGEHLARAVAVVLEDS